MAIQFAGVDLLLSDPPGTNGSSSCVADYLDKYQPLEDLRLWCPPEDHSLRAGQRAYWSAERVGGLCRPNYPVPPPVRLNELYWPTGATRWAWFVGLADHARYLQIVEAVGNTVPVSRDLVLSQAGYQPIAGDGTIRSTITTKMFLLPPRPISSVGSPRGLYLIPLVDIRYFWQFMLTGTFTIAGPTWAGLFSWFTENLTAITTAAVNAAYGIPDLRELRQRQNENSALVLDAAAHTVGRRFVRRLDGTTHVLGGTESKAFYDLRRGEVEHLVAGNDIDRADSNRTGPPGKVRVVFRRAFDRALWTAAAPHVIDSTAAANGISGTKLGDFATFYSTAIGLEAISSGGSASGVISNQAGLTSLATRIAADHYAWFGREFDFTIAGLHAWKPSGLEDHVLYRPATQGNGQPTTRVVSMPPNFRCEQLLHELTGTTIIEGLVTFTLAGTLAKTSFAQATITITGTETATIMVFDIATGGGLFEGTAGKIGIAHFDQRSGRWQILQLQCP